MRAGSFIIMAMTAAMCCWGSDDVTVVVPQLTDSLAVQDSIVQVEVEPKSQDIGNLLEKSDSAALDNWFKELKAKNFDVKDTTIHYPRFVDFCVRTYRWADKTFNTYDTSYVYSIPLKWKVMFGSRTRFDTYHFSSREDDFPVMLFNTEPRTTAGFRVSFMALGFEYMPDIDNLISGQAIDHRLTRFTFTCSRVFVDLYYNKTTGESRINRFGDYDDGSFVHLKFEGLTSKTLGLDVFYVFNNKKYAHAAAYSYSKKQLRSAGSFILGFQYDNQKLNLDFTQIPEELSEYNPWPDLVFQRHHYDYAINLGYAYNWVFHHNWLFNITMIPSIGLNHTVEDTVDGAGNKLALNLRGRIALVRNAGRHWFYALNGSFNGYFGFNSNYRLYNQISEISLTAGFRF